jgi:hypothetical protein
VRQLGRLPQSLLSRFVDMLGAPRDARGFDLFSGLFVYDPGLLDDVGQPQRLRPDIGLVTDEFSIFRVIGVLDDKVNGAPYGNKGNRIQYAIQRLARVVVEMIVVVITSSGAR